MLFTADHEEPRRALQKFIAAEINPSCNAGRGRVMSGSEISSREPTSDRGGLPEPVKRSTMSSSRGGALALSRKMSVVLRMVRDARQERAPHHEDNRRDGK
jgi:citronellyl-CoA dehydrogenase